MFIIIKTKEIMTIILKLENGYSTTANVASYFTMEMVNECFLGTIRAGFKVIECVKSSVTVY